MTTTIFDYGLDLMKDWESSTFKFLLLKGSGYTVNRDHQFVSSLTPASNEASASGYSRQTAGTKTRTVDTSLDRITYTCASPNFGSIAAGNTISGMVLYKFVTNDADSILLAHYSLPDIPTSASAFVVTVSSSGLLYVDQGA